ncbi:hypothetical protein MTR67_032970 [Solanum verrucosum]|uniref:PGG domain-containing protein n=1 Tax=Solanum verrucosum TaxID=315347 RepID=A0AAF0U5H8_SOLVR|nr:hypothetical protein MTR67_032970 [Solanum verrucosum]
MCMNYSTQGLKYTSHLKTVRLIGFMRNYGHEKFNSRASRVKLAFGLCGINARLGQRCDFEVIRQTNKLSMTKLLLGTVKDDDDQAKDKKEKLEIEKIMKSTEIQVVVATLIMTVSFTAGFTLPGGLDDNDDSPNKGMATLIKKTAFRAFAISDVLAFTFSASAIRSYFTMANRCRGYNEDTNVRVLRMKYRIANVLQLLALYAAVVAFATGMYATLENSHALAVTVCVISSTFFLIFYWTSIRRKD